MFIKKQFYIPFFLLILFLTIFFFPSISFALQKQKASPNLSLKETIDIFIPPISTIVAIAVLWSGVEQYKKEQKWKKAEFVAKEIKEFKSDPVIKKVMLMLDWNQREIKLSDKPDREIFKIDAELLKALQPKTYFNEEGGFTPEQSLIRDHFDTFFDYLEKFDSFIEVGLVEEKDFLPYLYYWINLIGNKNSDRKSPEFYEMLWSYIDYFGYEKVQRFMLRYGYSIKPN